MLYDIDPADLRPPRRRCEQGCEHANHRRLSRTVRAKKSVDLTRFDHEIDTGDRVKLANAAG
jgi:ribosomal protein L21E